MICSLVVVLFLVASGRGPWFVRGSRSLPSQACFRALWSCLFSLLVFVVCRLVRGSRMVAWRHLTCSLVGVLFLVASGRGPFVRVCWYVHLSVALGSECVGMFVMTFLGQYEVRGICPRCGQWFRKFSVFIELDATDGNGDFVVILEFSHRTRQTRRGPRAIWHCTTTDFSVQHGV